MAPLPSALNFWFRRAMSMAAAPSSSSARASSSGAVSSSSSSSLLIRRAKRCAFRMFMVDLLIRLRPWMEVTTLFRGTAGRSPGSWPRRVPPGPSTYQDKNLTSGSQNYLPWVNRIRPRMRMSAAGGVPGRRHRRGFGPPRMPWRSAKKNRRLRTQTRRQNFYVHFHSRAERLTARPEGVKSLTCGAVPHRHEA